MLAKLAYKNLRKSLKDYAIYFFTLVLGVAIFYVFNALSSQTVMMDVSESTLDLIGLMLNMLSSVSVFVSVILGLLIVYASRFLMKRRSQEFGIYLTLGMSKWKISLILLLETLLIGTISLVVGLAVGVALSQLMGVIVVNMFEANMTKFAFTFSPEACGKTVLYFGLMYCVAMIFTAVSVGHCKLIDLLNGAKKSEKVKMKNPWLCTAVFIFAVVLLSAAYYLVDFDRQFAQNIDHILIPIVMGVVATFLIFWSLSGLLLKVMQSWHKVYYRGLNSFVLRQFSSKINTTVVSSTVICLMLFVTICLLSSCLTIKNSMNANLQELAPADLELMEIYAPADAQVVGQVSSAVMGGPDEIEHLTVLEALDKYNFDLRPYLRDYIEVNTYADQNLSMGTTLGGKLDEIQRSFPFLAYDTLEPIMKLSDYNKVAEFYGNNQYTLDAGQYLIVADFESMVNLRDAALAVNTPIEVFGQTLLPRYNACQDGFVEMSSNHINTGIIVVPDEVITDQIWFENTLIANYNSSDKAEIAAFEQRLNELEDSSMMSNVQPPSGTSKFSIKETTVGLSAMVTFIGLYVGIVFLTASATILALKELSESSDNRLRYGLIRQLGADQKTINRALFLQIAIFFLLPLILALIHSVFGMILATKILEVFGDEQMVLSMVMTAVFLVVIYGGYFGITYYMSKNIIR